MLQGSILSNPSGVQHHDDSILLYISVYFVVEYFLIEENNSRKEICPGELLRQNDQGSQI